MESSIELEKPFISYKYIDELIDLLPETIWNPETTFLDITCMKGDKLYKIYEKLDKTL